MAESRTGDPRVAAESQGQLWPMGAVSRRTGIGEHTLRAWERRFGFPAPLRLDSGHRRFTTDQVQQLLLISAALGCGYRAGDVVPLTRGDLEELLRQCGGLDEGAPAGISAGVVEDALDACRRFDRDALSSSFARDASKLGVGRYLRDRVAPMLREVGDAWLRGDIAIRHEHFFTEVLEDQLRGLRAPLELSGRGRPVVLATLPDELHGLGLHMAALVVALSGRAVRVLGPNLPVAEIAQAAAALDAIAVGISVSVYGGGEGAVEAVADLRAELEPSTRLWVGGGGCVRMTDLPEGVDVLVSLGDLDAALLQL